MEIGLQSVLYCGGQSAGSNELMMGGGGGGGYGLNPVHISDKLVHYNTSRTGIKPFGQSHLQTDRCTRHTISYNQLYDCLDLFYLLNYFALALTTLDQNSDQVQIL